ncbi:MAG: AI-2E family transporter [Actinomycetes bacterium]|jgi:predicted PurR-regulated permease PerM|nr:AI-2E family transporter [Actinomycetes bacterium]
MDSGAQKNRTQTIAGTPRWLRTAGMNSLYGLLMVAGLAALLWFLKEAATISVPFIIAVVVAIVAHPLVKVGDRIRLPRMVSAAAVILIIIALAGGAIWITASGVISQGPAIARQLSDGVNDLGDFAHKRLIGFGVSEERIDAVVDGVSNSLTQLVTGGNSDGANNTNGTSGSSGLAGVLSNGLAGNLRAGVSGVASIFSGAFGAVFGLFIGFCCLYYFLTDYERLRAWVGDHINRDPAQGEALMVDATRSLRGYFKTTTITALVVDVAIGIGLGIMGVPLLVPILIVTFLTAYIPFFGAIISGLFACLIALGHGGLTSALIALVIVVVAQNFLQALINNKLMGDSLNLHPIVVLVTTLLGSTFAGLLGAALAAPVVSIAVCAWRRIKQPETPDETLPATATERSRGAGDASTRGALSQSVTDDGSQTG